jgi:hypothetical protein
MIQTAFFAVRRITTAFENVDANGMRFSHTNISVQAKAAGLNKERKRRPS